MEALGAAASVIAVVSLTLQLTEGIETTKEIWRVLKAPPGEVCPIVRDLDLLKGILDGIRASVQLPCDNKKEPAAISSVLKALVQCEKHVGGMTEYSRHLQREFAKKRILTAIKTRIIRQKISEFQARLEQAKTTLLLAVNVATFLLQGICFELVTREFSQLRSEIKMEFAMQSINSTSPVPSQEAPFRREDEQCKTLRSAGRQLSVSDILLWLLQLPANSPYRKYLQATGTLMGRISWRSSAQVIDLPDGRSSLNRFLMISIHIPVLRRAFTLQSQQAVGQWTHTFRVTRIVPDTSPIFRLCATEDESAIRRLFDDGRASPYDQTPWGVTLLHAAAAGYRCGVYKFLQDLGVEYSLCDHPKYGKLAPVQMIQNITVFTEGKYQTVQEWLSITYDETCILHPEINYMSVVKIWSSSLEREVSMTDEEIMTMLQGPLCLPHHREASQPPSSSSSASTSPAVYSSSLLLFCYYFLFRTDPHGRTITDARLHSATMESDISVFEYLSRYWDHGHWIEMLSRCHELDFHALAQRQQEKYQLVGGEEAILDQKGQRVRKKKLTLRFGTSSYEETRFRIGTLEDFVAVFEFQEEWEEDGKGYREFNVGREVDKSASCLAPFDLERASSSYSLVQHHFEKSAQLYFFKLVALFALIHLLYLYSSI